MEFLGLRFCIHACVFVSILLGHADGKTLIVQEGGQAVLETHNLGNNTHQWTWSKGRKSVYINVQDSNPQVTLQSVFPNGFWDPQTGHLILKPVKAEDLGFWKCEQEVISWEGGSKVTKIEETACFLDVSQRTTIRPYILVPEWSQGCLRCQSIGGNPKVAMRGVVSTDPSGNEVIRELPLLNPTKNVAFGTAETVFQFDPDRLDLKKPFLVCIGSQFRNGRLEFQTLDSYPRVENRSISTSSDPDCPDCLQPTKLSLVSSSKDWVLSKAQTITCQGDGGNPEASLRMFMSLDQGGTIPLRMLDVEQGGFEPNVVRQISRYEPRLEDESRFIVCQAQQQNVEDPWTTRRAIEVKDIQFGPIFLEIQGRSHLQVNANPRPRLDDFSVHECQDPACQSIRETKLEIELKFQVVDPQILELDLSLAPSPQLENGSRKYYQLQVQHPQGDTTKIITFSNEVNEMRFHWLWLLLIVVVASVIVFASAVCMVNHWRSKRRNPTETADEESSGTSVCPSYDVPYEFTNGSEHYYERIKNEDLLEPIRRLQLLPTDE